MLVLSILVGLYLHCMLVLSILVSLPALHASTQHSGEPIPALHAIVLSDCV